MSPNSTVNPSAKKIANIADFVTLFDEPRNDGLFYLETLMYLIQRHQRISNLQMLLQLNKMFSILMPKSKISTLPDHYSNLCSIFFFFFFFFFFADSDQFTLMGLMLVWRLQELTKMANAFLLKASVIVSAFSSIVGMTRFMYVCLKMCSIPSSVMMLKLLGISREKAIFSKHHRNVMTIRKFFRICVKKFISRNFCQHFLFSGFWFKPLLQNMALSCLTTNSVIFSVISLQMIFCNAKLSHKGCYHLCTMKVFSCSHLTRMVEKVPAWTNYWAFEKRTYRRLKIVCTRIAQLFVSMKTRLVMVFWAN